MRFRKGEYAVMANVEKMFHQIYVWEKDRDALRFLWRDKPTDKICDYITNVHLFGKIDSPCCASWSLKKTATDQANYYCNSSIDKVLYNLYMDDYLDSFTNRINAIKTIHDVINILNTGGFRLHKGISNDREILLALPNSEIPLKVVDLELNDLLIKRALGLLWDPQKDVLQIKAGDKNLPVSKRGILSFISSIFDPLRMIAPAILEPKLSSKSYGDLM